MYLYSVHPIWVVLKELNLPDEIVDKIMGYKTFYSPINYTFSEYSMCKNEEKKLICWTGEQDIQNDMINLFMYVFGNSVYDYNYRNNFNIMNNIVTLFIEKNTIKYNEPPEKLFDMVMERIRGSHNEELLRKERKENNITLKHSIQMIQSNLKFLLTHIFIQKINSLTVEIEEEAINDDLFYNYEENRFNLDKLWTNICYILRNPKIPDKTDLLMFNYMMGIKFKKSWNKKKLISNLLKNEANNYNVLKNFIENPERYNMKLLYDNLKKKPFSSETNADFNKIEITLN